MDQDAKRGKNADSNVVCAAWILQDASCAWSVQIVVSSKAIATGRPGNCSAALTLDTAGHTSTAIVQLYAHVHRLKLEGGNTKAERQ